jgi:hypothetical protein
MHDRTHACVDIRPSPCTRTRTRTHDRTHARTHVGIRSKHMHMHTHTHAHERTRTRTPYVPPPPLFSLTHTFRFTHVNLPSFAIHPPSIHPRNNNHTGHVCDLANVALENNGSCSTRPLHPLGYPQPVELEHAGRWRRESQHRRAKSTSPRSHFGLFRTFLKSLSFFSSVNKNQVVTINTHHCTTSLHTRL